ncbi:MAG: tRNA dihydrouridine(20/20a) synthase DusA [Gammaproteobacteria bacterium]|nr:tRNA dihydrouridine(20/20a) synthase DusA [Gammaproteobacteria bacterium]
MTENSQIKRNSRRSWSLCVAPMMAWTNRHCRYLHRLASPGARLFTEMITAGALLYGPRERLLAHSPEEQPLVVQLGGADPNDLARAAKFAASAGFIEINLNVGCPSSRVQQGAFGAALMRKPELVAECVSAMKDAVDVPVTVKCRLGVDSFDTDALLTAFVGRVAESGCERFYVHARKAILGGLSPAQNREVPPLQPERVYRLKNNFPDLNIVLKGGINDVDTALAHLAHVDGVMVGRSAYQDPNFLTELSERIFGDLRQSPFTIMEDYLDYIDTELARGTRLSEMSRHTLGLFNGMPGARRYRRCLSDTARLKENDSDLVREALQMLSVRAA